MSLWSRKIKSARYFYISMLPIMCLAKFSWNFEWDVTKSGNGERGTGNECTAVFRITIQNGGRRKRRTRTISVQVFVGEGFTS